MYSVLFIQGTVIVSLRYPVGKCLFVLSAKIRKSVGDLIKGRKSALSNSRRLAAVTIRRLPFRCLQGGELKALRSLRRSNPVHVFLSVESDLPVCHLLIIEDNSISFTAVGSGSRQTVNSAINSLRYDSYRKRLILSIINDRIAAILRNNLSYKIAVGSGLVITQGFEGYISISVILFSFIDDIYAVSAYKLESELLVSKRSAKEILFGNGCKLRRLVIVVVIKYRQAFKELSLRKFRLLQTIYR